MHSLSILERVGINEFIPIYGRANTVYPKKYAHGFCFAVLCCGYTLTDFPISNRLTSLALWQSNDCPSASKVTLMNMDKYFMWIHYERLHNHNKAKHNKTVCIFLGIYCTFLLMAFQHKEPSHRQIWFCYSSTDNFGFNTSRCDNDICQMPVCTRGLLNYHSCFGVQLTGECEFIASHLGQMCTCISMKNVPISSSGAYWERVKNG